MVDFKVITDKRKISKNKGIQILKLDQKRFVVYVGNIKKSKIVSKKKSVSIANKILKERIKRIRAPLIRLSKIQKKRARNKKILKFISKFI